MFLSFLIISGSARNIPKTCMSVSAMRTSDQQRALRIIKGGTVSRDFRFYMCRGVQPRCSICRYVQICGWTDSVRLRSDVKPASLRPLPQLRLRRAQDAVGLLHLGPAVAGVVHLQAVVELVQVLLYLLDLLPGHVLQAKTDLDAAQKQTGEKQELCTSKQALKSCN